MTDPTNKPTASIQKLYETPLPSTRSGPLYNVFSYPTKISPEAIAVFIATHTKPGATVLDAFGGSGTTGVAAMLCDRPTDAMKGMAEQMGVTPAWGPRNAYLYEIGTLGSFIASTLCSPPDVNAFAQAVKTLCKHTTERIGQLYAAKDPSGQIGTIRHVVWSDILLCPSCGQETPYWDAAVRQPPLTLSETFICPGCNASLKISSCERSFEVIPDLFGGEATRKKRVIARVYGKTGTRKWHRRPVTEDLEAVQAAEAVPVPKTAPNREIEWGDLQRSGYHKGITKLHHFYTRRNFIAVATMWELAESYPDDVRSALKLLILSYNASHSTLMTRVVVKNGQKDLVLTGAQSGVLYISGLPVEKNVIEGVMRKSKAFVDAFSLLRGSRSRVEVRNASSERIDIPDSSIDYVFTDPPFGGYIPYAEINQINELWLGKTTDRDREIIVSASQNKDVGTYATMMGRVFSELARVLKPTGFATVVFHSAHSEIWRSLISAYSRAGFSVEASSVLDKIQSSFKQVVSRVSVKGDPLLLLGKRRVRDPAVTSCRQIAEDLLAARPRGGRQMLYSKFVGRCLEEGVCMDMDAKEFYALAEERLGQAS